MLAFVFLLLFSRQGAKNAKNLFICFVLTSNTFACFAPWRDLLILFLAEAQGTQRTALFVLFLPRIPLRALCPGEIY